MFVDLIDAADAQGERTIFGNAVEVAKPGVHRLAACTYDAKRGNTLARVSGTGEYECKLKLSLRNCDDPPTRRGR
jgi:hypothetical protein